MASAGHLVLGLIILRFDRVMMRLAHTENAADRRYWSSLSDALLNILSIFALKMRAGVLRLVETRLQGVFKLVRRAIVYNEAKWASVDLLNSALWIALVAFYVWLTMGVAGGIALGSLFMVYEYAVRAGGVITGIAAHFQSLARQQTDYASAALIWSAPAGQGSVPAGLPDCGDWQCLQIRQDDTAQVACRPLYAAVGRSDRRSRWAIAACSARGHRCRSDGRAAGVNGHPSAPGCRTVYRVDP